jgi:hypothetical protein
MRPPGIDAAKMLRVEIARPPGDIGTMAGEMNHVLAGAAAGLDHVACFAGKKLPQYSPDHLMITVKRRSIETAVGLNPSAIPAELHDKLRHAVLPITRG